MAQLTVALMAQAGVSPRRTANSSNHWYTASPAMAAPLAISVASALVPMEGVEAGAGV